MTAPLACDCGADAPPVDLECPYALVVYGEDKFCSCCGVCRDICLVESE